MGCGASNSAAPVEEPPKAAEKPEEEAGAFEEDAYDSEVEAEFGLADVAEKKANREPEPEGDELGDELEIGVDDAKKEEFLSIKPWLGAITQPTDYSKPEDQDEAPSRQLVLEHAHGYRGREVRSNVYYTQEGNIVYMLAAVGVVLNPSTGKQMFFQEHDDDIVSLTYHAGKDLVATGQVGKTPQICVWEASTCNLVATFKGFHKRAVVSLAFSASGDLLASVGLDNDHSIAVYSIPQNKMVSSTKGDTARLFDIAADADNENEFATVGKNHIAFWSLEGGVLSKKKGLYGSKPRVTPLCCCFAGGKLFTGHPNGTVYTWVDRRATKVIKAHKGAVYTCIRSSKSDSVLTGSKAGEVVVLDFEGTEKQRIDTSSAAILAEGASGTSIRAVDEGEGGRFAIGLLSSQIVEYTEGEEMKRLVDGHYGDMKAQQEYGELWALATHPSENMFVTGGEDGTVRIWDCDKMCLVQWVTLSNRRKILSVGISSNGSYIGVGCTDGSCTLLEWNMDGLIEKWTKNDAREKISQVVFSPNGEVLAAGSHDNAVYVYRIADGELASRCTGNTSYITHIDFSEDGSILQTNSGSYELLFFDPVSGKQDPNSSAYRDEKWATWTCTLGWPVQGIWPKFSDGSDVNTVDRSHDGEIVATGEDSGLVKLFKYPCLGSGFNRRGRLARRPLAQRAVGHSEHVTCVRFMPNDDKLISVGGADLAIFQWRVVE